MTKQWIAVLEAADAAARWHVHLRRKGAAEEPYINHQLEVAILVATPTDGKDPGLVIAAPRATGGPAADYAWRESRLQ
jgi:(p)ppGpp synthase/HD superfamily hydrolase